MTRERARRMNQGASSRPVLLNVSGVAKGGDGVAHVEREGERRAVFVPRSAPGDVVEAEVDFAHKPARARVLRVVQPSLQRVAPPCAWVERCGGCDWMHLAEGAQVRGHAELVSSALAHALHVSDRELPDVITHPAEAGLRYRTRARLAVVVRRGKVTVGYRRANSRDIEPIGLCIVLVPQLDPVIPLLGALFVDAQGEGEVSVALGASERPVLDIKWTGNLPGEVFAKLERHVAAGDLAGAEVWMPGARQPARIGDPRAVTVAADGAPLVVPSGGFAQAHPAMNHQLARRLVEVSECADGELVELFAGSGNFTVLLARHARAVTAVESNARAVVAARANLQARALAAKVVEADADAYALPTTTRTVVLDPPRAGALGAMRHVLSSKARRVAYVSCDPATLARDVAVLAPAFRLAHLETFEMFPQTSHIESLAVLERVRGGGAALRGDTA